MTFDQAQSPRLGQRTPIESTIVQIFDVDPATPTADLIEAAWPGMLIFRQDIGILQIYNGEMGAWQDVAGGVAGQLTYVGPDEPAGGPFRVGDVWYDSDAGYKPYVWNGTAWVPTAGAGGIQTHYDPGFVPDAGGNPVWVPIPGATGDVWYQSDDQGHVWWFDGTAWIDVTDPTINQNMSGVLANADAITSLQQALAEASFVATSANNTADTADGRVSMSDYEPGTDDVVYEQTTLNPDTGQTITTLVPRVNGSIWFVRTRPRRNLCANPSLETNTSGWTASGATLNRANNIPVPAGEYTLLVTNSGLAEEHSVAYGLAVPVPCTPGNAYSASVYAELVAGSGAGMTLSIIWLGGAGTEISRTTGAPYQLLLNAFDPAVLGTRAEPRLWVAGTAPAGAVWFYVRQIAPAANTNDTWHTGAMLIEAEDDLGRYFDGSSVDGYWDGTAHAAQSVLRGDQIQEVWELRDSEWIRKWFTDSALASLDVAKLVSVGGSSLNGALVGDHTLAPDKMIAAQVLASEALAAGDLVNLYSSDGAFLVRRASSSLGYEAHGFAWAPCAQNVYAYVHHTGYALTTGLSPGSAWLGDAGKVSARPPSSVGALVQKVGSAPSANVLNFAPTTPVLIT